YSYKKCSRMQKFLPLYYFDLSMKARVGLSCNSYISVQLKKKINKAWTRYLKRKKGKANYKDFQICELSLLKKLKKHNFLCTRCTRPIVFFNMKIDRTNYNLEYSIDNTEIVHKSCRKAFSIYHK